jgi:hypothetical protein
LVGRLEQGLEIRSEPERERPPVETLRRALVTGPWLSRLSDQKPDFLEQADRPANPGLGEIEVAMADKRPPVDREGHFKAPWS